MDEKKKASKAKEINRIVGQLSGSQARIALVAIGMGKSFAQAIAIAKTY